MYLTADNVSISWEVAPTPFVQSGLLMASGRLFSFCSPALAATGSVSPRADFESFDQG
jgi:hypothetical protein